MKPIIRFESVSKRYNLGLTRTSLPSVISRWIRQTVTKSSAQPLENKSLWALDNISFELKKGESLALIGPNGAGKSTILKLLAKVTSPTSGQIEVNGQMSALIELGAGFHPDLTGRENIFLNGAILGLKRKEIEQRFAEIVDFSDLERFIDTPVKRYSSGMAVRLGFAVASCIEPDILLVDEVLAVGDAAFRQKCIDRIKKLLAGGTSLIFVSHNMELVKAICASAIYLEQGQVQLAGSSTAIIDAYNQVLDRQRAARLSHSSTLMAQAGHDIEITNVEIFGAGSQPTREFYSDQPLEVRVHYLAYRPLGQLNMVVRLLRVDGLSCCIVRTSLDNFPVQVKQGRGFVAVTLNPLQLYGGMYYAVAWVMDADDVTGITNSSSDFFQVKNRDAGRDHQDAVFEPVRSWRHDSQPGLNSTNGNLNPQIIYKEHPC